MTRRPGKANIPPTVEAQNVLCGRARLTHLELIQLIHRINPTPRNVAGAPARELYRIKASLQSLLIREYPDVVRVTGNESQSGIVSLVYRYGNADACHAVVDELEPDARAWVRFQLDMGDEHVDVPESEQPHQSHQGVPQDIADAATKANAAELIRLSIDAVEEYEYEAAREWLTAAVQRAGDDFDTAASAAVELLALLIDTLAAYEDALSLYNSWPKRLRQHPDVCVLGAVAAARAERRDLALELVAGHAGERAAEALMVLARTAASEGQLDGALVYLTQAERAITSYHAAALKAELADLRGELEPAGELLHCAER